LRTSQNNIPYVVWKGISKYELALLGLVDLDIYIPESNMASFKNIAIKQDWIEVDSRNKFQNITHFYCFDKSISKFVHIHIYFNLRTGSTLDKSYFLNPSSIISERVCNEDGVFFVSNLDHAMLHYLRINLKKKGFLNKLFYFKERFKHNREQSFLHDLDLSQEELLSLAYERYQPKNHPDKRNLCSIIFNRFFNKLLNKKKLFFSSTIVSIIGSDGSGKSTLSSEIIKNFKKDFEVKHYSFGRPSFTYSSSYIWIIRQLIFYCRAIWRDVSESKNTGEHSKNILEKPSYTSIISSFALVLLAFERKCVLKKSRAKADNGNLVVLDRCPSLQVGQMDGPKILPSNFITELLSKLEIYLYQSSVRVDLVIKLEVPVDVLIHRNKTRNKLGKESVNEIKHRFNLFKNYTALSNDTKIIDGSAILPIVLSNSILSIIRYLNKPRT
jgi:thymidylate kinase